MGADDPWRGAVLVPLCLAWTLLGPGSGPSADAPLRSADSRVLWRGEANLDDAPGNERAIHHAVAETVAAPWGGVVVHRQTGSAQHAQRVWTSDGCAPGRIELRDLDADAEVAGQPKE